MSVVRSVVFVMVHWFIITLVRWEFKVQYFSTREKIWGTKKNHTEEHFLLLHSALHEVSVSTAAYLTVQRAVICLVGPNWYYQRKAVVDKMWSSPGCHPNTAYSNTHILIHTHFFHSFTHTLTDAHTCIYTHINTHTRMCYRGHLFFHVQSMGTHWSVYTCCADETLNCTGEALCVCVCAPVGPRGPLCKDKSMWQFLCFSEAH